MIEVLPCKNTMPDPIEEVAALEEPYSIANSKGKRIIKPNPKCVDSTIAYALSIVKETLDVEEPSKYVDAILTLDSTSWLIAMNDELKSLYRNKTWDLDKPPKGKKIVDCK